MTGIFDACWLPTANAHKRYPKVFTCIAASGFAYVLSPPGCTLSLISPDPMQTVFSKRRAPLAWN